MSTHAISQNRRHLNLHHQLRADERFHLDHRRHRFHLAEECAVCTTYFLQREISVTNMRVRITSCMLAPAACNAFSIFCKM